MRGKLVEKKGKIEIVTTPVRRIDPPREHLYPSHLFAEGMARVIPRQGGGNNEAFSIKRKVGGREYSFGEDGSGDDKT